MRPIGVRPDRPVFDVPPPLPLLVPADEPGRVTTSWDQQSLSMRSIALAAASGAQSMAQRSGRPSCSGGPGADHEGTGQRQTNRTTKTAWAHLVHADHKSGPSTPNAGRDRAPSSFNTGTVRPGWSGLTTSRQTALKVGETRQ
jgi:hypothetical protein